VHRIDGHTNHISPPPVGGGEGGYEVKLVEVSLERLLGRTKGGGGGGVIA